MKRMFEQSRQWAEGGVVYGGVVRDRDSDVKFSIRFIYKDLSLCGTCTRLKDTDAKSPEWKKFVLVHNLIRLIIIQFHHSVFDDCSIIGSYIIHNHIDAVIVITGVRQRRKHGRYSTSRGLKGAIV